MCPVSMRLDVIPLCDSWSPRFVATRFVVPAIGGSAIGSLVRRPVAKLIVGVVSILLAVVLCVLCIEPALVRECRAASRVT